MKEKLASLSCKTLAVRTMKWLLNSKNIECHYAIIVYIFKFGVKKS